MRTISRHLTVGSAFLLRHLQLTPPLPPGPKAAFPSGRRFPFQKQIAYLYIVSAENRNHNVSTCPAESFHIGFRLAWRPSPSGSVANPNIAPQVLEGGLVEGKPGRSGLLSGTVA